MSFMFVAVDVVLLLSIMLFVPACLNHLVNCCCAAFMVTFCCPSAFVNDDGDVLLLLFMFGAGGSGGVVSKSPSPMVDFGAVLRRFQYW
jgi:hypothetical protein